MQEKGANEIKENGHHHIVDSAYNPKTPKRTTCLPFMPCKPQK